MKKTTYIFLSLLLALLAFGTQAQSIPKVFSQGAMRDMGDTSVENHPMQIS